MEPGPKRVPAFFYRCDTGREPVREWLKGLEPEVPLGRIARTIFCIEREQLILLHGFIKKTQKTPQHEIDLALKRKREGSLKDKNIGSSLDSWLREEGIYEDVSAVALKRVLARQVAAAMEEKQFSKAEMARRMGTSRAALDRLLDPDYDAVTLSTLRKAAQAVGRQVRLELL